MTEQEVEEVDSFFLKARRGHKSLNPLVNFLSGHPGMLTAVIPSYPSTQMGSSVVLELVKLSSVGSGRNPVSEDSVVMALDEIENIVDDMAWEQNFNEEERAELFNKVFNSKDHSTSKLPKTAIDTAIVFLDDVILKKLLQVVPIQNQKSTYRKGAIAMAIARTVNNIKKGHLRIVDDLTAVLTELDSEDFLFEFDTKRGFPLFNRILETPELRHPFFAFLMLREPRALARIVHYYTGECPPGLKNLLRDVMVIWSDMTEKQLERGEEITYTPDFTDSLVPGSCVEREIRALLKVQERVFLAKEEQLARDAGVALLEENQGEQYPEFNLPYLVTSQMLAPETQLLSRRRN